MHKRNLSVRLISLILTLSFLVSAFAVFATANDTDVSDTETDPLNVAFNRTFDEGWDLTNGMVDGTIAGNYVGIEHEFVKNSGYNHYLIVKKMNTSNGYASIDLSSSTPTSGKVFIELDIAANAGNAMGGAISIVRNDGRGLPQRLLEFREDGIYVFTDDIDASAGYKVGTIESSMKWKTIKFEFDFDYSKNTEGATDKQYKCTATYGGKTYEAVLKTYRSNAFGIKELQFYAGGTGTNAEAHIGEWYCVDDLKIYSGVDEYTEIPVGNYGSCVDAKLVKDFPLMDNSVDVDGFLRGEPTVDRVDGTDADLYYNRGYGEGWTLENGLSVTYTGEDYYGIGAEKTQDGVNYFGKVKALNTSDSFLQIALPTSHKPYGGNLYFEIDLKASVNCNLGGIIFVDVAGQDIPLVSIKDSSLYITDKEVGYIGTDWVTLSFVFKYNESRDGKYVGTVYYGKSGSLDFSFQTDISNKYAFTSFKIGMEGGTDREYYGDWFCFDDLKMYEGVSFLAEFAEGKLGTYVSTNKPKDFNLNDVSEPYHPLEPEQGGGIELPPDVDVSGVLSGAPSLDRVQYDDTISIEYNRGFEEGWDHLNGLSPTAQQQIFQLGNELTYEMEYNYFLYCEATNSKNGYLTLTGSNIPKDGRMFFEFDIKASEGNNCSAIIQILTPGGSGARKSYSFSLVNGNLQFNGKNLGKIGDDEWTHIALCFDFTYCDRVVDANSDQFLATLYYGETGVYSKVLTCGSAGLGLGSMRIGFNGTKSDAFGQYYRLDNLQLYGGYDTFATLPEDNYGLRVNSSAVKDFPIQTGAASLDDMINDSLFLKVGVDYGYVNSTRTPNIESEDGTVFGGPVKIDGEIMVPLEVILEFVDLPLYIHEDGLSYDISTGDSVTYITVGRKSAIVGGERIELIAAPGYAGEGDYKYLCVAMKDLEKLFPGYYVATDAMNLIIFSQYTEITKTSISDSIKLKIMKDFIYEYFTPEELYDRVKEHTNNFTHPYILTNQEQFDFLKKAYSMTKNDEGYDAILTDDVQAYVKSGAAYVSSLAEFTGDKEYVGLKPEKIPYNPYPDSFGYDPKGGRLNESHFRMACLTPLAIAYNITGDLIYAKVAYDWMIAMGNWEHWGPGHMLNCADASQDFSLAYDWLYNAFKILEAEEPDRYSEKAIVDIIYSHGAYQGYRWVIGQPLLYGRSSSGSNFTTMVNNWNAVCTSGVSTACLSIMGYQTDEKGEYPYLAYTCASTFNTLIKNGLDIYAPDGSYAESLGYWSYGATNLFWLAAAYESATGTDFGLMDTWGLDSTCYFVCNMESSDYNAFNYNDGGDGTGSADSSWFYYVSRAHNDPQLAAIRQLHRRNGKGRSFIDMLFYIPESKEEVELDLDFYTVGLHAMTARSSWDKGALFVGFMGGNNDDPHGHIDSGNFIYYNKKVRWFVDVGPEGYNVYKYFGSNNYYKKNPEGHNVLCLSSSPKDMPYGQSPTSISLTMAYGKNDYGSYLVIDNTPAYGKLTTFAYRGVMLTNDRKTVVVQDEVSLVAAQTFYWFGHYNLNIVGTDATISEDGRTAYLTNKSGSSFDNQVYTLRVSIVTPIRRGYTFEIMTAYDTVLESTMQPGDSEALGGQPEGKRAHFHKLAIKCENVTMVNVAVVIEIIDPEAPVDVGYSWTPLEEWEPYADNRSAGSALEAEAKERTAQRSLLQSATKQLENIEASEGGLLGQIDIFYRNITNLCYTVNTIGRDSFSGALAERLPVYDRFKAIYDAYQGDIAATTNGMNNIAKSLIGF